VTLLDVHHGLPLNPERRTTYWQHIATLPDESQCPFNPFGRGGTAVWSG